MAAPLISLELEIKSLKEIILGGLVTRLGVQLSMNDFTLRCIPPRESYDYGFEVRLNDSALPHTRVYLRKASMFVIQSGHVRKNNTPNSANNVGILVLLGLCAFTNSVEEVCRYLTPAAERPGIPYEDGGYILFEGTGDNRITYE